jgi:glycine/D-amino acid oxidase-like deaminating enzyme
MAHVVVLGGGISGLSLAHYLARWAGPSGSYALGKVPHVDLEPRRGANGTW